jgi:SAM-dependent methyltransferase
MQPDYTEASSRMFSNLADWFLGPVKMGLLQAAIELRLPDLLWETGSLAELTARLNAHQDNLERLLDGLTAMELIEKKGPGQYANTRMSDMYLRTSRSTYLGEMVQNLARMQHSNMDALPELVLSGPPEIDPNKKVASEEHWKASARHLAAYHRAGAAAWATGMVEQLPEFPNLRRMLDLGGGPGLIGMSMVARHPSMQGVLCDLPAMVSVAREEAQAMGLSQRMSFIEGDYNQVDIGRDYDLIWASHNLYFAKDLPAFVAKLHQSLSPGGVFVSIHEGLTEYRTKPADCVLSRLNVAMEGQDTAFNRGVIAQAMHDAGFDSVESREVHFFLGPIQLDIARKRKTE